MTGKRIVTRQVAIFSENEAIGFEEILRSQGLK